MAYTTAKMKAIGSKWIANVEEDGNELAFVPYELITEDLCRAAVKNFGGALQHVPDNLKTMELCMEAVKNNSEAINYVPEELQEEIRQKAGL